MSGFVYNTRITDQQPEEAAGKVGMALGVIASIMIPVAAPAIWATLSTTGIGTALASFATSVGGATFANVLGSATVGAIAGAGNAYLNGARGGDVWRAAGISGLSSGGAAFLRGASPAAAASGTAAGAGTGVPTAPTTAAPAAVTGGTNAIGGIGPVNIAPPAAATVGGGAGGAGGGVVQSIANMFGSDPQTVQRVGAALVNAAVNGTDMGNLNGLVAQQRAELEALAASDNAMYAQRISEAQKILQEADRMDPAWWARLAMADAAGMAKSEFAQTMRNIAVKQGGSLDKGQRKAYQRGSALSTARTKALAYNNAFADAKTQQQQMRATGLQFLGPNTAQAQHLANKREIEAGQLRAQREANHSTWGGLAAGIFGPEYDKATSPAPGDEDRETNPFTEGSQNPFGLY